MVAKTNTNPDVVMHEFDSEQIPDLTKDVYIQDIHCVGSLCKLYFRELPNPLLTYQLYEKFSDTTLYLDLNPSWRRPRPGLRLRSTLLVQLPCRGSSTRSSSFPLRGLSCQCFMKQS
uniref:Rho-GAP domain-containing protein n=1 Tax=Xiphophorus couchianus TaxID=32473 RepID=A0A3B5MIA0_9TELE